MLAACSSTPVAPPAKIITETEYVAPPKPILPKVDPLSLKDVEFVVITPDNIDEIWANLENDQALIAITPDGYEKIASNLNDLRSYIAQQKQIILVYEGVWDE